MAILVCFSAVSAASGQDLAKAPKLTEKKALPWQMPADVTHHPDLTYRETENGPQKLDLVAPQTGEGPFPVVVIIHAIGPWAKERKSYLPQAAEIAREGCIGVVISYRHMPSVAYPKGIEDTEAAIRWLRVHAAEYKIDSNRIAALGYSGGGALACLLGMNKAEAKPEDKTAPSSRVQAVVAYYPPTDFTQLHKDCTNGKVPGMQGLLIATGFQTWLGGTPAKVPARFAQASPVTHVSKDMAPILLIHGNDDAVVPIDQAQLLAKAAAAKKGRLTLVALSGAGHGFDDERSPNTEIARESARAFLNIHLQPKSSLVASQR